MAQEKQLKTPEEYYAEVEQPATLAEFLGVDSLDFKEVDLSTFAHVIIDAQRYYTDPSFKPFTRGTSHTKKRSEKLAKIAPLFRQAGIKTAFTYFDWCMSDDFNEAQGGFYKVVPRHDYGDLIIPKNQSNAFDDRHLHEALQEHGIKNIFISGFNACACVHETVIGATKRGYNTVLLEDCIGQDSNYEDEIPLYISHMMKLGAQRSHSAEALEFINDCKTQSL